MAELTIQLQVDPQTGKKNVWIKYRSDPDALPMEHEEQHRAWVDKLLQSGVISQAELGDVTITRQAAAPASAGPAQAIEAQPLKQGH